MNQAARIRPSLWHLLWASPFIVIGASLFVYTLFHGLAHLTDSLTQVVVPGATELHLQPAVYTVFLEQESTVNGKIYSTTQSVAGLACRASSVQTGSSIGMRQPSMSTTYSVNGRSGRSVLEFPIQQEGRYRFACDYGESTTGPQVVVAVGTGVGDAIFVTVAGGIAELFGGLGAGAIVILIVVIRRERAKKRLKQPQA